MQNQRYSASRMHTKCMKINSKRMQKSDSTPSWCAHAAWFSKYCQNLIRCIHRCMHSAISFISFYCDIIISATWTRSAFGYFSTMCYFRNSENLYIWWMMIWMYDLEFEKSTRITKNSNCTLCIKHHFPSRFQYVITSS